ncbi:MAG TPA: carbohydrate ABC transporter permease [Chloroflexota bacterium]|nr:carbohydrate ABC transporter permease [Chloroflexota bacterium]
MDETSSRQASSVPNQQGTGGVTARPIVQAMPARGVGVRTARRRRVRYGNLLANVVFAAIGLGFALPLLWMLLAAFDTHATNSLRWPAWGLNNFTQDFKQNLIVQPFLNSMIISGVTTVITTLFGLMAAYPISRGYIPFKRPLLYSVLFATGLPVNMLIVPVYSMFVSWNLTDSLTWAGVFLAATSLPFAIWILKNFIDAIPMELEEAAQVDGASAIQIIRWITLPLATPGIVVNAMLTFLGAWGYFLVPYIFIQSQDKMPFAVTIYGFQAAYGQISYGPLAAAALIFSAPVIILYWAASRHLIGAFNFGGGLQG